MLGYEFSVVNAFLFFVSGGIFALSYLNRNGIHISNSRIFRDLLNYAAVIVIIPFIIINIKTIFGMGCSFVSGLLLYFVISLPSIIIGIVTGSIAYFMVNKFRYVFFFMITILILLLPVIEIYFYPQIYFYNPIVAYFPGSIYDEAINVSLKLLVYRLINLVYFGFIGWGIYKIITLKYIGGKASIAAIIIFPALTFFFISPKLGFSTDIHEMKTYLNNSVTTEHFIIHYPDNYNRTEIEILALTHEYYYEHLSKYLQTIPQQKINTFIFESDQQKKVLFGSANADVAKPWLYQAYLSYDRYPATLQHELAHCFSAEFGTGAFKLAHWFNPSLIEGIASASDPFYDDNFITYMAALAYQNGFRIELNRLFDKLNFFGQTASISYIYSGAFTLYLIETYGIDKYKSLYSNLNFKMVYQKNIDELELEFINYIKLLEAGSRGKANFYFGRKSIIYKTCPRYIAVKNEEAWLFYNSDHLDEARLLFEESLSYGENYSAILGLSYVYSKSKMLNEAISIIESYLNKFENTSYYYHLQFRLADLFALHDEAAKAVLDYENIYDNNPNRTLFYLTAIRKKLLSEGKLDEYLNGSDFDKLSVLRKLNTRDYFYPSWAVIIDLSEKLDESINLFLEQFDKTILVTDYESSFAVYKLSQYLLKKGELTKARKMAALTLRFKGDENFRRILDENFKMVNWINNNSQRYLNNIIFN